MGSAAYSWTLTKMPEKDVLKVIGLKSGASSFAISDMETLPSLTLADCPQGPSHASNNKLFWHKVSRKLRRTSAFLSSKRSHFSARRRPLNLFIILCKIRGWRRWQGKDLVDILQIELLISNAQKRQEKQRAKTSYDQSVMIFPDLFKSSRTAVGQIEANVLNRGDQWMRRDKTVECEVTEPPSTTNYWAAPIPCVFCKYHAVKMSVGCSIRCAVT